MLIMLSGQDGIDQPAPPLPYCMGGNQANE